MKNEVVSFCRTHNLRLPVRDIEDYRLVPPGVYTHKQLPYGPLLDGITNGVIAFMVRQGETPDQPSSIVEVHLDNLNVILDPVPGRSTGSFNRTATKPKTPKTPRTKRDPYNGIL